MAAAVGARKTPGSFRYSEDPVNRAKFITTSSLQQLPHKVFESLSLLGLGVN